MSRRGKGCSRSETASPIRRLVIRSRALSGVDNTMTSMAVLTIAANGDFHEQRYWALFASKRFPSYEPFWRDRVAPLTHRDDDPTNVYFRSDAELRSRGFTSEDVTIAQLHYTLLFHLGRVFDLLCLPEGQFDRYSLTEGLVYLTGANDVADELLQRRATPGAYKAWDEQEGANARRQWRHDQGDVLADVRGYRNRLVHGRIVPEIRATLSGEPTSVMIFPSIDKVNDYLDWRRVFSRSQAAFLPDFDGGQALTAKAWRRVIEYVEQAWSTHLVPP